MPRMWKSRLPLPKLQPNITLYKYFIDYLYDAMPFYLAYEVRVVLSVTPTTTA